MTSSWILLIIAGLLEVAWAIGLKYTEGFSRPLPTLVTVTCMVISMLLLGKAAQHLPIGTAYGVWVGIGVVGATILGVILFKEPATITKLLFLVLLITSIMGLKFSS